MAYEMDEGPGGFGVPEEIEALVDAGVFEHTQWVEGAPQIFSRKLMDDTIIHISVDHEDPLERICDGPRYVVTLEDENCRITTLFRTDNAKDAADYAFVKVAEHLRP